MIYRDNRQEKIDLSDEDIKDIENTISYALEKEKVNIPWEISLLFVDNDKIREINKENRGIDKATDVLSFPMLDYEDKKVFKQCYLNYDFDDTYKDGEKLVLGDIVLSLERALEQSEQYNHSLKRETNYLVIHSVLHLLGYDHIEEQDKKIMRKREEEILEMLDIRRESK